MTLPDWWRRPGESRGDWEARRAADFAESQRRADARREAYLAEHGAFKPCLTDRACGVGTYDGNGNPKGLGW